MRGGIDNQVNYLFNSSDVFKPGASKHDLKDEIRFAHEARGEKANWHDLGKELPITSFKTAEAYKDVWHQVANYIKDTYNVKNVEKFTGDHINGFLTHKVNEGMSKATFSQYCAACEKLEVALKMYADKFETGKTYSFDLSPARDYGNEKLNYNQQSRAYENPKALIGQLEGRSEIIASVQYEGGARVSEVLSLKTENFLGDNKMFLSNTKGGLERVITVSTDTYQKVLNHVESNGGKFVAGETIKEVADQYRDKLKEVAKATAQDYNGSHGLRWSYAQESYNNHIKHDFMTPEQSLSVISKELGHIRSDITLHYLK